MQNRRRKGFTLVEVLIALIALSILMGALFGFYLQIREVVYEQTRSSMAGSRAINAIKIITHDLQNLIYEPWNDKYFFKVKKGNSRGLNSDTLNFISASLYSNPALMQANVYSVTYYGKLDDESGRLALVRTEDIFVDYTNTSRGVEVPLLEDVTEFRTEFSHDANDWRSDWDMALMQVPPKFIRVYLTWLEQENERNFTVQISPGVFY